MLAVARELVGCELRVAGVGGVIVETEAYRGDEPACHGFVGLTPRTQPLFGPPGHAYVYLSYGIHSMLNVVTEPEGTAAAVLVRAVEPRWRLDRMRVRRGVESDFALCSGPGKLAQALGVGLELNRRSLLTPPFELRGPSEPLETVAVAPRIGITRATELPWRFCAAGSRYLSRPALAG
ncbi:MAG: DNA-3-methyladenine glycosylase [Actinomycetota bacterium]|nr:DNA-3-methyladenine glycosylase [Actinomycetota bacterium]